MTKKFDDKIKESLIKGTDDTTNLKEDIWNKIDARLKENEVQETRGEIEMISKQKRKIPRLWGLGTIAAALLIMFLAGTTPGHAAIDRIKELFVPEKTIVEEIEGNKENSNVALQKSRLGYIIYFDEEVYKLESLEGKDRIAPISQADYVPEVFIEIEEIQNKDVITLAKELEELLLKEDYETVRNEGKVEWPIESIFLYGNTGNNWDDMVVKYYLIDNTQGGTFLIKQQLFFEASEGFGVRFDNMLKEFEIISLEE